jgi:hypothetical protein
MMAVMNACVASATLRLSGGIALDELEAALSALCTSHRRFDGSVSWRLTDRGLSIDGAEPQGTPGQPVTVRRVRDRFGTSVERWGTQFGVPAR